ncbi:MAG: hypothetical protein KatS3mg080_1201 [Anoxybacillus sp.]|nr:MAG: hypothetical protein KatS3mg080_1201 [Anoxybacillus sp.]
MFATSYVKGNDRAQLTKERRWVKRKERSVEEYVAGVLNHDRTILAQAITLIESNAAKHTEKAQRILHELLPYVGRSIRIGITGVPGAGKSTFIEAFGQFLCEKGHRVAVLAIDPSSSLTGGSILGDKTRMEHLARHPRAFIRPSPSGARSGACIGKHARRCCFVKQQDMILFLWKRSVLVKVKWQCAVWLIFSIARFNGRW